MGVPTEKRCQRLQNAGWLAGGGASGGVPESSCSGQCSGSARKVLPPPLSLARGHESWGPSLSRARVSAALGRSIRRTLHTTSAEEVRPAAGDPRSRGPQRLHSAGWEEGPVTLTLKVRASTGDRLRTLLSMDSKGTHGFCSLFLMLLYQCRRCWCWWCAWQGQR